MIAGFQDLALRVWCATPSTLFGRRKMTKAPATTKTQGAFEGNDNLGHDSNGFAPFRGTTNPRHLRVLAALMDRPLWREELDGVAGCSNGPDLISDLRRLGLEIPCSRKQVVDCDGKLRDPGMYSLTGADRLRVMRWQSKCSPFAGLHVVPLVDGKVHAA